MKLARRRQYWMMLQSHSRKRCIVERLRAEALAALALALCCGAAVAQPAKVEPPVGPPVVGPAPENPPPLSPGVPAPVPGVAPAPQPPSVEVTGPAVATSVSVVGNTAIPEEELVRVSGLQPGEQFTGDDVAAAVQAIQSAYAERGYVAVVLDVAAPAPGESGPVIFRIAELTIVGIRLEGLRRVNESAVRQMLETQPGRLYNLRTVTRDLVRLQQLGVFENVRVELEPVGSSEAILVWHLEEKAQLNYAELGGSYAPQSGLEAYGQVILGNLHRQAQRLTITGLVNTLEGALGGEVGYYWPWIAPHNTSATLNVYSVPRYEISGDLTTTTDRYFERHSGFQGTVGRQLRGSLFGEAGLRYESVDVSNFPASVFTNSTTQNGQLGLLSLRGTWDRRNSALNPTSGTYSVGFVEGGFTHIGSTGGLGKAWGDRRWYLPLRAPSPQLSTLGGEPVPTLALRTMLGGTAGQVPFYEQFFVGGIGDLPLRGYREGRFWGKYAFLANVELRWPFTKSVSGVIFVDAGDAWGSPYQFLPGVSAGGFSQHRTFSPRAGVGFGFRVGTGVGPVRLDFGYGDAFRVYFGAGQSL